MDLSLVDIIKTSIRERGFMTTADYMALCLGHPKHGYYMTRDPFGVNGDFVTAPEISQMFGEMIGLWCADLWIKMGRPTPFALVELGPGRGTLMEDVLRTTRAMEGFHATKQLYLMEMSPVLQSAQRQKLAGYNPEWIVDIAQIPEGMPVIIVANEFLDALPVRQMLRENNRWYERVLVLDKNDTLGFAKKEADLRMVEGLPPQITGAREDGLFEMSPVLNHVVKSVGILLQKQKGVALFLDYGHAKSAYGETLQAVKNHEYVPIFDTPGMADLTAHVDFENLGKIAQGQGMAVHGPTTQGAFLKELGIEVRAERLKAHATQDQRADLDSGLKRLIDTDQMGTLFKVLALCDDPNMEIAGFHDRLS